MEKRKTKKFIFIFLQKLTIACQGTLFCRKPKERLWILQWYEGVYILQCSLLKKIMAKLYMRLNWNLRLQLALSHPVVNPFPGTVYCHEVLTRLRLNYYAMGKTKVRICLMRVQFLESSISYLVKRLLFSLSYIRCHYHRKNQQGIALETICFYCKHTKSNMHVFTLC